MSIDVNVKLHKFTVVQYLILSSKCILQIIRKIAFRGMGGSGLNMNSKMRAGKTVQHMEHASDKDGLHRYIYPKMHGVKLSNIKKGKNRNNNKEHKASYNTNDKNMSYTTDDK
jgi:hypothetical protein